MKMCKLSVLWLRGSVVTALDSQFKGRESYSRPVRCQNNSGQPVHTHVPLSPSSIIWYRPNHTKANSSIWKGMAYYPRN